MRRSNAELFTGPGDATQRMFQALYKTTKQKGKQMINGNKLRLFKRVPPLKEIKIKRGKFSANQEKQLNFRPPNTFVCLTSATNANGQLLQGGKA